MLSGGIKEEVHEIKKTFMQDNLSKKVVREMERTILMDSGTIINKYCQEMFFIDLFICISYHMVPSFSYFVDLFHKPLAFWLYCAR